MFLLVSFLNEASVCAVRPFELISHSSPPNHLLCSLCSFQNHRGNLMLDNSMLFSNKFLIMLAKHSALWQFYSNISIIPLDLGLIELLHENSTLIRLFAQIY